jgi:hypothetical protein
MDSKTMKEEVEAVDRKVLSYCGEMEAALASAAALKPGDSGRMADGLDMTRAVHRQVLRARNLAWAVQRLPYLDLSFMTTMKKMTFRVNPRGTQERRDVEVAMPAWVAAGYPSYAGYTVWQDPKSKTHESADMVGMTIAIPAEVVEANEAALMDAWLRPRASVPEVPAALRRRIDPFLDRFDQVTVIAEADWHAVPGADPLVVGIIHDGRCARHAFLLGEYDPTKLEKYIVAELAVRPKE